ncbi:glycoside hydrolase family 88/105 protein [Sphingomonas sp.]|uniref:glycoside hydrolase family 88/105 protein n=1 Tax=Sphingomonas sp. TaxID=28214 RepID=UPI002ED947A1
MKSLLAPLAVFLALQACSPVSPPATTSAPASGELPSRGQVLRSMERMADWQLSHLGDLSYIPLASSSTRNPRDWQQAAFWVALTHLADRSGKTAYRDAIFTKGRELGWKLGDRLYHADDHLIGSAWIWAARHGAGAEAIAPTRAVFDQILAAPKTHDLAFSTQKGDPSCTTRWCWCDALFMAPPTLEALSRDTGDPRYAAFSHSEYKATADYLFDSADQLFFRDSRFFDRRGEHGEKLFWSRGNGWVISGLARLIPEIAPNDPRRTYYIDLFKAMAERLAPLQRANGYWPPSLLGDPERSQDESSGTGFYVHALAWGIKASILERDRFLPEVARGWAALERAIQPDGRLGWVQQVSDRPEAVKAEDTQFYGVGAYLLAGAAVYDLAGK